jgi:hypothetical protein
MRLNTDARLPQNEDAKALKQRLYEINRDVATQVNAISEGAISGASNAAASIPTTGVYAKGDFVRNSAPVELGTVGSKYVVWAWLCIAAPLTFVQMRSPTGN